MIGHKKSHLASVTFQVLALGEMKVPLVWDMCDVPKVCKLQILGTFQKFLKCPEKEIFHALPISLACLHMSDLDLCGF